MEKLSRKAFCFVLLISACIMTTGCLNPDNGQQMAQPSSQQKQAKYIFLFIGDGMGMQQRVATEVYLGGPAEDGMTIPKLTMNSLPVVGLTRTHTWAGYVTDSAASGTAIATGRKTRSGHVSVDPVEKKPMKTIAEIAQEHGWRIGLVSSSPLDDATPAAFYAHQESRGSRYEISMEAADSGVYYFAGSGPAGIRLADDDPRPSPLKKAIENGVRVTRSRAELMALKPGSGPVWAFNMPEDRALGMSIECVRGEEEASLADYTRKGIELLDNPQGFFMMVEGGLTDWAGHGNCLKTTISEVLALDAAVREALLFYALHPDETLIIVTADHETGGLSMGSPISSHNRLIERVDSQKAVLPVVMQAITSWRENKTSFEDALPEMMEMMGWPELKEHEIERLRIAYAEGMKTQRYFDRDPVIQRMFGTINPLQSAMLHKTSEDSGFTWTTGGHSGQPVMTTAIGVGAELFGGYHDNTDICRYMLTAAGLPLPVEPAVMAAPKVEAPAPAAETEAVEPAQVRAVQVGAGK